ncbi:sensor histidine kinase [Actinoplanes sp. CA-051413]|uniref:sensor histidine kinase n=1 Tax=Actinoplanes sp. CA-051413 TaxID=3239899 RepID=UPI003D97E37A
MDRLVAVSFVAVLILYAVVRDDPAAVPGVLVVGLALDQRRRRPVLALAVLLLVAPLCLPLWAAALSWSSVLYLVASTRAVRTSLAALAVTLLPAPVALFWAPWLDAVRIGVVALLTLGPVTAWTLGYTVRQRRAYREALRCYELERAAADAERTQRAFTEERLRIARELHDVVAQSMGVVTVQAGYGFLVFDDQPERARAALAAVEEAGREALTELRRLLGVMRNESGSPAALSPAPGLDSLHRLFTQTAGAGVHVSYQVTGSPFRLPAGLDLTAYRIVQEALTNIVRHAGTDTGAVTIDYQARELCIEVIDAGRGGPVTPGGHGLVGMRERVAVYGGRFTAAPRSCGGFRVSARLPLPAGAAGAAP